MATAQYKCHVYAKSHVPIVVISESEPEVDVHDRCHESVEGQHSENHLAELFHFSFSVVIVGHRNAGPEKGEFEEIDEEPRGMRTVVEDGGGNVLGSIIVLVMDAHVAHRVALRNVAIEQ